MGFGCISFNPDDIDFYDTKLKQLHSDESFCLL